MTHKKKCHNEQENDQQQSAELAMSVGCHDPLMGPQFELAEAYVRFQCYHRQYRPEVGLELGTIFPDLYCPYPVNCC